MRAGVATGEPTSGGAVRLPLLERWLTAATPAQPIDDWRADAQRWLLPDGVARLNAASLAWAAAATTAAAPGAAAPGAMVYLAQPLHTEATLSSIRLPARGLLQLEAADAQLLAADFAALPNAAAAEGGSPRLMAAGARLFFGFDRHIDAHCPDPASLVGFDLREFRPAGRDARRLAALRSEVEMWLFSHPLNQARQARGEPAITTLWPWGGGAILPAVPPLPFAVIGEDVMFGAWARQATVSGLAPLLQPAASGRGCVLIICEEGISAAAFEALLAPHLDELQVAMRDGLGALHISAGRRRCSVSRMPRRWFAPRTRPWWELFDEPE
jgi:hypothetical protein